MRRILLYIFLFFFSFCYSGFAPDTLVFTFQDCISIDQLHKDSAIASYDVARNTIVQGVITHHNTYTCFCAYKVICDNDISFVAAPEQRVMVKSEWRAVKDLKTGDRLWCYGNTHIIVQDIQIIVQNTDLIKMTVLSSHTFFVTSAKILAHNHPVIMITAAPVVTSIIAVAAKAIGILGLTSAALYSLFAKNKSSKRNKIVSNHSSCSAPPVPPEDEKEKRKREEDEFRGKHPHGRYEDASYHKSHQSGRKGARPTNGQEALDNSHLIEGQNRHRISVNNQKIVVLYETGPGLYHGHVRIWSDLTNGMRNTLIRRGLTSIKGKFLK